MSQGQKWTPELGAQVKTAPGVPGMRHQWTFEHTDGRQHDDQLTWRS